MRPAEVKKVHPSVIPVLFIGVLHVHYNLMCVGRYFTACVLAL